jgi:hypothetical protein
MHCKTLIWSLLAFYAVGPSMQVELRHQSCVQGTKAVFKVRKAIEQDRMTILNSSKDVKEIP